MWDFCLIFALYLKTRNMNCLTFSLKYKAEHKDAKIKVENHFINIMIKYKFDTIIRFFKYVGFVNTIKIIILPHFYVVDGDYRIDYNKKYIDGLEKKPICYDQYNLNEFNTYN